MQTESINSDGAHAKRSGQPAYLTKRGAVYYFKRKIPIDVRGAFNDARETVWVSLKTQDLDEARQKLPQHVKQFNVRCEQYRSSTTLKRLAVEAKQPDGVAKYLMAEHIPFILKRYEHSLLVMDDHERSEMADECEGKWQTAGQLIGERKKLLGSQLEEYQGCAVLRQYEVVEELAAGLLAADRLIAPPGTKAREELLELLLSKEIRLLEEQLNRLDGKGADTPSIRDYPPEPRALETMRDAFHLWSLGQSCEKTVDAYGRFLAEFEQCAGCVPLISLSEEKVASYRDSLLVQQIQKRTAANRIGALATMVARLVQEKKQYDRVEGLFRNVNLDAFSETPVYEERRPFTVPELRELFSSDLYRGVYQPRGQSKEALYWLPPIGAFAGPRIEEAAQLRADDIYEVEGTWVFHFRENGAEQHLKNRGSFRRVPVHDELIRFGFIDYVLERQRVGGQLFPSLTNENKYRRWAASASKRFAHLMDRLQLTDSRLDYHSFRYTFRQQCTNCGIDNEARDALTGHWLDKRNGGATYLKDRQGQYPLPALVNAMKQFRYADLNLSHLYQ